ncbi:MAG: DUF4402 domain-containing protein [Flavisolibacter sp.]|nr:DUF4402 domain-containing protein [Flavisolibacter sp.]
MKKMSKFTTVALALILSSSKMFAQSSATATASATIVTPISISKTVDLEFGNVAVSPLPGTVILSPDGDRTATGGVTLPAVGGTVSAASFSVFGEGAYTYSISLPEIVTLTRQDGSETMTVDEFISDPSGTGTLMDGAQVLNVGATLHVSGSQVSGTYVSNTPFAVTVNYN